MNSIKIRWFIRILYRNITLWGVSMFSHSRASFLVFGYSNRKAGDKPVRFYIPEKGKQTQVKMT